MHLYVYFLVEKHFVQIKDLIAIQNFGRRIINPINDRTISKDLIQKANFNTKNVW